MKHIVKSIPAKGKLKNGDNYRFFEDKASIIAVVADGVGGRACDWKASEQLCEDFILFYREESGKSSVRERISYSLTKSFARLYRTEGPCEGMLSTLVGLITDKNTSEYFYFGIGDSLILKFEGDKIEELTPESAFVPEPEQLANCIKSGGKLAENTSFALMTDGISANRERYREELAFVLGSENWETKFDELMQLNRLTQFDDMTLMLLKVSALFAV